MVHFRGMGERGILLVDGNEKDKWRRGRGRLAGSGMRIGESGKVARREERSGKGGRYEVPAN